MLRFSDLPDDVISDIFSSWGDLRSLARLDTAFCELNSRCWFLEVISIGIGRVDDNIYFTILFLSWLNVRKVKLSHIRLDCSSFDDKGKLVSLAYFRLPFVTTLTYTHVNWVSWRNREEFSVNESIEEFIHPSIVPANPFQYPSPKGDSTYLDHSGLINVINQCVNLKVLIIDHRYAFKIDQFAAIDVNILSNLTDLSLKGVETILLSMMEITAKHCHYLRCVSLTDASYSCSSEAWKLGDSLQAFLYATCCQDVLDFHFRFDRATLNELHQILLNANIQCLNTLNIITHKRDATDPDVAGYLVEQFCKNHSYKTVRIGQIITVQNSLQRDNRNAVGDYPCDVIVRSVGATQILGALDILTPVQSVLFHCEHYRLYNESFEMISNDIVSMSMHLTSLTLIDGVGCPALYSDKLKFIVSNCYHLTHLHLLGVRKVSNACLEEICKINTNLSWLELSKCDKVMTKTVCNILKNTKNGITKVTTRQCILIDVEVVFEVVREINNKKRCKKVVVFYHDVEGQNRIEESTGVVAATSVSSDVFSVFAPCSTVTDIVATPSAAVTLSDWFPTIFEGFPSAVIEGFITLLNEEGFLTVDDLQLARTLDQLTLEYLHTFGFRLGHFNRLMRGLQDRAAQVDVK